MPEVLEQNRVAIPVEAAVRNAVNYLKSLTNLMSVSINHLMIEEVQYDEKEGIWLVTLGYDDPNATVAFMAGTRSRILKKIGVDGTNGNCLWMTRA
jgi:hypothetical protein